MNRSQRSEKILPTDDLLNQPVFLHPPPRAGPPGTSPEPPPASAPPPPRSSRPAAATTSSCASPWRSPPGSRKRRSFAGGAKTQSCSASSGCHSWRNEAPGGGEGGGRHTGAKGIWGRYKSTAISYRSASPFLPTLPTFPMMPHGGPFARSGPRGSALCDRWQFTGNNTHPDQRVQRDASLSDYM